MRVGQGFDVHQFGGPGPVVLGGVSIPHEQGLLAHSDGDVLWHALSDALLGAIGAGDIGVWFPDHDPQYAGADSGVLLQAVYAEVQRQGWQLVNLDLTVITQVPKINPHRKAIQQRTATLLKLPEERVNIKATTTEGLGFTGRAEGIASQAIVLLEARP